MDLKALYNLSYGVFILGVKDGNKLNACITNTCMQVASEPVRISISILNKNLTCQMIKNKGSFTISVLDKTCSFNTISHFGMQSGRDVEKFNTVQYSQDLNENPFVQKETCTVISAKVISSQDLGTHTLFVAEIQDAQILSSTPPLTYADYQKDVKPKPTVKADKKIVGWRCKICGYIYQGENLPADFICPLCGHPADDFEPIYET